MRSIIIVFVILGLFLLITSEKNLYFCKKLIGAEVEITEYNYFSNLSDNYYGTTKYWKELSIINNSNINSTDEELIVPTMKSINKLYNEGSFILASIENIK